MIEIVVFIAIVLVAGTIVVMILAFTDIVAGVLVFARIVKVPVVVG